jgi:hypothetical protein
VSTKLEGCGSIKRQFWASIFIAAIVIAVISSHATAPNSDAATLTVANTNDSGAGSLRLAIANAAPGDTVDFNAVLSGQTITLTSGELFVGKSLTISGPAGGITVSGNDVSRVFRISGAVVNISGISVSHGNVYLGAGILNTGGLTMTNLSVSSNNAGEGAGLTNDASGTVNLVNVTVSGNRSG